MSTGINQFFRWVKAAPATVRGVTFDTMLRVETHYFIRLGGLIERADSTAASLDVQNYHVLPQRRRGRHRLLPVGRPAALSLSAFEVYRKVYRDVITPRALPNC